MNGVTPLYKPARICAKQALLHTITPIERVLTARAQALSVRRLLCASALVATAGAGMQSHQAASARTIRACRTYAGLQKPAFPSLRSATSGGVRQKENASSRERNRASEEKGKLSTALALFQNTLTFVCVSTKLQQPYQIGPDGSDGLQGLVISLFMTSVGWCQQCVLKDTTTLASLNCAGNA